MIHGLIVMKGGNGCTYLFSRKSDMINQERKEIEKGFKTRRFYKPFSAVRCDGENSCIEWGIE